MGNLALNAVTVISGITVGLWLLVHIVNWWRAYQIRRWRRRGER